MSVHVIFSHTAISDHQHHNIRLSSKWSSLAKSMLITCEAWAFYIQSHEVRDMVCCAWTLSVTLFFLKLSVHMIFSHTATPDHQHHNIRLSSRCLSLAKPMLIACKVMKSKAHPINVCCTQTLSVTLFFLKELSVHVIISHK